MTSIASAHKNNNKHKLLAGKPQDSNFKSGTLKTDVGTLKMAEDNSLT